MLSEFLIATLSSGLFLGYLLGALILADGWATIASVLSKVTPLDFGAGGPPETTEDVAMYFMSTDRDKLAQWLLCPFCSGFWLAIPISFLTSAAAGSSVGVWLLSWMASLGLGLGLYRYLEGDVDSIEVQEEEP